MSKTNETTTAAPEPQTSIAAIIAQQIGHRAFLMMGTNYRLAADRSLTFDIHGCRDWQKVRVTLEPSDLYRVEFFRVRSNCIRATKEVDGIYADGLHHCIEANTGLALSL